MITVDWGNYEETIIVMRIEGAFTEKDCRLASFNYRSLMMQTSSNVDLILDIRLADNLLSKLMRCLNYEIENRLPNLNNVIVLGTAVQERSLHLIANFYPQLIHQIIVVESVDDAYQLVTVA